MSVLLTTIVFSAPPAGGDLSILPFEPNDLLLIRWPLIGFAVVGAIVGEWRASDRGLGYYLLLMQGDFDTAGLFATILTASFTSIALYLLVARLERLFLPWHVSVRGEQQLGLTV